MKKEFTSCCKAEQGYRNLFMASNDAVMTFDIANIDLDVGFFVSGNPAALKMFKMKSEQQFTRYPFWRLSPELQPDGRASIEKGKEIIKATMLKGYNRFEWTHTRSDGELFITEVTLSKSGVPGSTIIYAIVRDVTERKNAEQKLKENEATLALALKSSQMGVWEYNVVTNKRSFDKQVCSLFDIDYEKFQGTSEEFFAVVHPDDRKKIKTALAQTVEKGIFYAAEYRSVWKDGTVHNIIARGTLIRDSFGVPAYIIGVLWDITARKKIEQELAGKQRLLSLIIEGTNDGIWDLDVVNNIFYLSPRAKAILGYKDSELENKFDVWEQLIHHDDLPLAEFEIKKCSEGKESYNLEQRLRCKNGQYKWVLVRGKSVHNEAGMFVRLAGSITDIDYSKQMMLELIEAKKETVKVLKIKEDLLSIISHDIKSPLGMIKTAMDFLLEEQSLTASMEECVALSLRQSKKGLRLIEELLSLQKLEAGDPATIKLYLNKINVKEFLEEITENYKKVLEEKGVLLSTTCDDNYEVMADSDKLEQILNNLINNSIKYTQQGGEVSIRVTSSDKKELVISVSDTGEGIPENALNQIFEKYGQANTADKRRGSGIGLTIARYLCNLHKGDIWVESKLGQGATFTFTVPNVVISGEKWPVANKKIKDDKFSTLNSLKGNTILVVDDVADERQVVRNILEKNNYRVMEADGWEGALEKIRTEIIKLVLLDIEMPEKNGWELLEMIRKERDKKALPVIIYTGKPIELSYVRKYGANDVVKKHESSKTLLEKIQCLLEKHGLL